MKPEQPARSEQEPIQLRAQLRGRAEHVLAVIQHHQQLPAGQHPGQRPRDRQPRLLPHPSTAATTAGTCPGSCTGASSTSQAPSANRPATRRATSHASRVFPEPPGPVTVTSGCCPTKDASSRTGPARPMKLVRTTGKPCTAPAETASPTAVP